MDQNLEHGLNNDFEIYNRSEDKNTDIAGSWIEASSWAINGNKVQYRKDLIKKLLIKSKGFVHFQDLKESDILLNSIMQNTMEDLIRQKIY